MTTPIAFSGVLDEEGQIQLPGADVTSPVRLGRPELGNWQGAHRENQLLVFRVDLPAGWYRVACTSAALKPLPVVDQTSFKCRAHDSVFAGARYGPPMKVRGTDLVEGSNVVEAANGQLRIVVGDAAYGGWIWAYEGPWYRGWKAWFGFGDWGPHVYVESWPRKLLRVIDPGFHTLRLNSLQIEPVPAPGERSAAIFSDLFDRDDVPDISSQSVDGDRWITVPLHRAGLSRIGVALYRTSLRFTGAKRDRGAVAVVRQKSSPDAGTIRYSTRVSLFTGEGSKIHSGAQEAGVLILSAGDRPIDFNGTFVGIAFDATRPRSPGSVRYRVGNGRDGYRTDVDIPDGSLPFRVAEGEYEIVVDHNVEDNVLQRIQINGQDITSAFSPDDRKQRVSRGLFGIRVSMDPLRSGVGLQQFYWFYRVEALAQKRCRPAGDASLTHREK